MSRDVSNVNQDVVLDKDAGRVDRAGLSLDQTLAAFVETEVLPGLGLPSDGFWDGVADIFGRFSARNSQLIARREELQTQIDDWHRGRVGAPLDSVAYEEFLRSIGYVADEPEPFSIGTENVDPELSALAGPQLVVPVLNARYVLNAANARWNSLYDALYGTDALPRAPGEAGPGYSPERGAKVITYAKAFLDEHVPLADGSHAHVTRYFIHDGKLEPALKDPSAFVGFAGPAGAPSRVVLRHHGLHIELVIDLDHPVGKQDVAGVSDVVLEAALSTIVDFEDSVAAVDGEDKVAGYRNWLGLMQGDLEESFDKGGQQVTRALNADRVWNAADGGQLSVKGRSVLLVRNVGHLMTTPAVCLSDGREAPEGILDAIMTSLIACYDLSGPSKGRNSATGSIYIVKPKMHGPDECAFTNDLFDAVEDLLGLARHTIKVGVMDEERRTSVNLAACIRAVKDRIVFINTGFLDRTGDEIHTSMRAGAMIRKAEIKDERWIAAYEARNVAIGLACGFAGRAQIGKGMWAAPDRMADMLAQKAGHPKTGANTAWVPSPTAAVLHAIHYHEVDVVAQRRGVVDKPTPPLADLLAIPLAPTAVWSEDEIVRELDNNAQGILGYVVRWIDQGVGCSKVPDINDIGLMEDRATLRISSQHIANWLAHNVCTRQQVEAAFERMAVKVDAQNAGDPTYTSMAPGFDGVAYRAALALVFEGAEQPSGYTEPLLHAFRRQAKALIANGAG